MDASLAERPDVQSLKLSLTNSPQSGYLPGAGGFAYYDTLYYFE
jgi:hypothetical protein